ncbi:hypothetical protein QN277_019182 [Acacia crassicarpa]|uniref:DUF868 family protein n=1 Tax=Acacia crassicarpa TaxID=499986 RepID=A0AAE1JXH1_9FABA|nr:hypothetical protein QN277_019182 [Acacia crassicarpa]
MASQINHQGSTFEKKKPDQEPLPSKIAQTTVTYIYQANIGRCWRNVSMTWCKTLMSHTLHLTIDSTIGKLKYTCKIDVKPWSFWSKKGYKSLDVDGHEVEVYWDVRSAKFSDGCPEPTGDYYVAFVFDDEVPLLVGDLKKKAYKRTKSKPASIEAMQVVKKENVFAKKSFVTRAMLNTEKTTVAATMARTKTKESEVIVESLMSSGVNEPEMSIYIEGVKLIHVKNLQWKFRGNETVMVNNNEKAVQVYWDVHDWLFSGSDDSSGPGVFTFKPGFAEAEESDMSDRESYDNEYGNSSVYYSTRNAPSEFCLILCAYKLD